MIAVEDLAVRTGTFALESISFALQEGEYGVLMGRTGSGKTTLLETICGLRPLAGGRIKLCGTDVSRSKPADRGIGYVPQDRALFMTMTVRENLAFALAVRKWDRAAIAQRVEELAQLLSLTPLLDRSPARLSGGEAQRVALGRALANKPKVLLLDEPLSSLDDDTRHEMHELLRSVRERTRVTALHVTHHLGDAQRLTDRVFLLSEGKVRETRLEDLSLSERGPGTVHASRPFLSRISPN